MNNKFFATKKELDVAKLVDSKLYLFSSKKDLPDMFIYIQYSYPGMYHKIQNSLIKLVEKDGVIYYFYI